MSLRDLVEGGHLSAAGLTSPLIEFACPHPGCGVTIRARADHAGSAAICPGCGRPIRIEAAPGPPAPPAASAPPIPLRCPQCHKRFRARPDQLGRMVRCPACGHRLLARADESQPEVASPRKPPEPLPGPAPVADGSSTPWQTAAEALQAAPEPPGVQPPSLLDLDWLVELEPLDDDPTVKASREADTRAQDELRATLQRALEEADGNWPRPESPPHPHGST